MKIAILGTVGVPARYGGFETLAENLVLYHHDQKRPEELTVYCSSVAYPDEPSRYLSTCLRYSRFKANGMQSIFYDALTLFDAAWRGNDVILLLGVSGAVALPFIRLFFRGRIITNVDGIEWKRAKWKPLARTLLRWSESLAVRFSHDVIADNRGIAEHIHHCYGVNARVVAYGGDQAVACSERTNVANLAGLPEHYAIALCRIEPENNIEMILTAFANSGHPLVFVGNWNGSDFGRILRKRFSDCCNLHLLDAVYNPSLLYAIRSSAGVYIHGHSAGGTNPALVEMMHFGIPIFAFACTFNRYTTENKALYFTNTADLEFLARSFFNGEAESVSRKIAADMKEIACRCYRWDQIASAYFDLFWSGRRGL